MDSDPSDRLALVTQLAERLTRRGWWLVCAESCTGGGIAAALTDLAGSSAWFDRGFVTYSNQAKQDMLGVAAETLARHGAVSRETAVEMARGALARSNAQLSVAVTGIAGPSGGTPDKPVGTVWLAWADEQGVSATCERFPGDRARVRAATIDAALDGLLERLR
jgi:nicotinamide-nucleotide amidase